MTFIASVIAKDGIAVIADSLVSSETQSLDRSVWESFIAQKRANQKKGGDFSFSEEEIVQLFELKPSHTKDFENKLFEYDDYTLISTAGSAIINRKRIVNLVTEIKKKTQKNKRSYRQQSIERKVDEFCNILRDEVKSHIATYGEVDETTLIFSHFNKNTYKPSIHKVNIQPSDNINSINISISLAKDDIICDGQPGIAYRILYGGLFDSMGINSLVLESCKDALRKENIEEGNQLPRGFFGDLAQKLEEKIIKEGLKEAHMFHISSLSLQQAADLAYLLLKVERDFQVYTKEIPTVGGHVKLATINEDGINFILGKTIIKPTRHL
ncbi:MAG: hypothetical protein ACRC3B_05420 [Bacteroidia bacterium]